MRLFTTYPIPFEDQYDLICYIANFPDDQIEPTLAEFEKAAAQVVPFLDIFERPIDFDPSEPSEPYMVINLSKKSWTLLT